MRHSPRGQPSMEAVGQRANFEGNEFNLMIQRMTHPKIRQQILDLLMIREKDKERKGEKVPEYDEKGDIVLDAEGKMILTHHEYTPMTANELRARFDETVEEISLSTQLGEPDEAPNAASGGTISPYFRYLGRPLTVKALSILEAHEKGHNVRLYYSETLEKVFHRGFDFSKIRITPEHVELAKQLGEPANSDMNEYAREYLREPAELAERMAQLKNYFGFRGAEKFTTSHLQYARENYVADTGLDNYMTEFFQAITPQTEKEFLSLVDNAGI